MNATIAVATTSEACRKEAERLAERLGLPVCEIDTSDVDILLVKTEQRLELRQSGKKAPGPVFADFVGGKAAHRRKFGGGRGIHLARAAGLKSGVSPYILDATAGLGQDAFVLASLGCKVTMVERSPVIAALLEDALIRASHEPELESIIARMQLINADAREYLESLDTADYPDVVYVDPMYPHTDKSALAKKEMNIFQKLLGADQSGAELLEMARSRARKRVTVKRPIKAPYHGDMKPDADIRSKNTRYDLYFPSNF